MPFFISGSFKPLASETENASIASPNPSRALCAKKQNVVFHLIVLMRVETENRPPKVD